MQDEQGHLPHVPKQEGAAHVWLRYCGTAHRRARAAHRQGVATRGSDCGSSSMGVRLVCVLAANCNLAIPRPAEDPVFNKQEAQT